MRDYYAGREDLTNDAGHEMGCGCPECADPERNDNEHLEPCACIRCAPEQHEGCVEVTAYVSGQYVITAFGYDRDGDAVMTSWDTDGRPLPSGPHAPRSMCREVYNRATVAA